MKREFYWKLGGLLDKGELFDSKQVQEIAANHGKSVAQIALAWSLAEGFLPLPKSVTTSRIQANLDCFGIELSHEERETLKRLLFNRVLHELMMWISRKS